MVLTHLGIFQRIFVEENYLQKIEEPSQVPWQVGTVPILNSEQTMLTQKIYQRAIIVAVM